MLGHLKDTGVSEKLIQQKISLVNKKKQICPICAKSFRCLAHLNRHKLIHTGERPYICNVSFNLIIKIALIN